jgi:hypothetical protein
MSPPRAANAGMGRASMRRTIPIREIGDTVIREFDFI